MNDMNNPRAAAAKSLISCEKDGKYSNLEINTVLNRTSMSAEDQGLYTALVYGVIERTVTLDAIIASLTQRKLADIDGECLTALRLGIYQLLYMNKIPDHAAVNESVALVPKKSAGFVNAILRAFLRSGRAVPIPDKSADLMGYLSVKYSAPRELCAFWVKHYGANTAESLLEHTIGKSESALRVNTLKTDAASVEARFSGHISKYCPDVVVVSDTKAAVSGIASGEYFIQDEASAICAKVLGAKAGNTVVDTCAAPGGKSFSVAIDMKNEGELYSFDLHRNKLSLIKSGAERLGITIIKTDRRDAKKPLEALVGRADCVLCDAPCSGLGVIAKKPDVKYKSLSDIAALPDVQYDVLIGASAYVKAGGTLVYSTCTLNPEENEGVVTRFLEANPDFAPCDFEIGGIESEGGRVTLFPHIHGTDGFFISKMKRAK